MQGSLALQHHLRVLAANPSGVVGLLLLLTWAAIALASEALAPYDALQQALPPARPDDSPARQEPSTRYWFGTDEVGRDVFSRVLAGARISLALGFISVSIGLVLGSVLGLWAGFYGGWTDAVIMRTMDALLAFPGILLALVVIAALGTSIQNVMLAVGTAIIPQYARLVRSLTLSIRELAYIEAAHVVGSGAPRILALFPPLILGWLGRPALGIAGAAWASTIASFAAVAASATLLVRAGLLRWSLRGCWASWVAVLHVGGPAIAAGLIVPASALVVTRLLAGHGHEVVAGFNVASRVELLVVMILWCASASVEPLVGQNWGARRFDRVDSALRLANGFCIVWGALTCAVLVAFGGRLAGLIDANPVVVEVAEAFFLVVPASMGLMGVMQVASSCFNARGRPMPAFVISLGRAFALHVPLAILGNLLWGYHGIFLATAATNVLMGASAWAWNRRSVRRDSAALMAARG